MSKVKEEPWDWRAELEAWDPLAMRQDLVVDFADYLAHRARKLRIDQDRHTKLQRCRRFPPLMPGASIKFVVDGTVRRQLTT